MTSTGAETLGLYPPQVLREYALLADGERGALVGPRGEVVWMCFPRWHSDAVFSALIGGSGIYAITPTGRFVWGGYYEDGSLVWRSRWVTETGIVECREALAFPGDVDRAVLLRRIIAVQGSAEVDIILEPAAGFGRRRLSHLNREGDCWEGQVGELYIRWTGGAGASVHGRHVRSLRVTRTVPEGGHHDLVLELSGTPFDAAPPDADRLWKATTTGWRHTMPQLGDSVAPRDARHAYAVLRGLTSSSGGMVAAATMSLPERAEKDRNYDYRYAWIRDQCYAGHAVAADAPHPLLDDAVQFVTERLVEDGPNLKPAYTVVGGPVPDQRCLNLPGYPGGHDIVGNHVNAQFQLDTFGEALLLFAAAARHGHLDTDHYQGVTAAVTAIQRRWQDADAGIWELDNRRWAHSRLICAAGLRAMAGAGVSAADAAEWSGLADAIEADVAADCRHPSGRWQRAPDDPRVDASLLLPAIRGALPPSDPRSVATVAAVRADLAQEGYVYRFRHDRREPGQTEGAFTLCGFFMALADHQQGETLAARTWFERNRVACGPPGLFSEEFDVTQRQLRGNLPQAFVHALLLETALRLTRPWSPCNP